MAGAGSPEFEDQFSLADFPRAVIDALNRGKEAIAVLLAISFGSRDESKVRTIPTYWRNGTEHGSETDIKTGGA